MPHLRAVPGCVVERVGAEADGSTVIRVGVASDQARCPTCHADSRVPHSTYIRRPVNLPSPGYRVRLELVVRRFYCAESTCARRSFAERLPGLLDVHARRTRRLAAAQRAVAIEVGAEAGARLTAPLGPAATARQNARRSLPRSDDEADSRDSPTTAEGSGGGDVDTGEHDREDGETHQQRGVPRPRSGPQDAPSRTDPEESQEHQPGSAIVREPESFEPFRFLAVFTNGVARIRREQVCALPPEYRTHQARLRIAYPAMKAELALAGRPGFTRPVMK